MSPANEPVPATPPEPVAYPFYVRVLAVCHVLSLILGPFGCVVLGGIARFLWVRRGFDSLVIGLSIAGPAWLLACILFRAWFVRFGRRHWPQPEESVPEPATPEAVPELPETDLGSVPVDRAMPRREHWLKQ